MLRRALSHSPSKDFRAKIKRSLDQGVLNEKIEQLKGFAQRQDRAAIIRTLQEMIMTYQPNTANSDKKT